MQVQIPRTAPGVVKQLTEIGELITAKEWHRAALVASVVRLGRGSGGRKEVSNAEHFSAREFAKWGVHGLRSPATVSFYVQTWLDTCGDYPVLGRKCELPDLEFPPFPRGSDGYDSPEGAATTIERIVDKHGPRAVAEAVTANPAVDREISRTRLDKVVTPTQREELDRESTALDARIERGIGEGRAASAEHIDHAAELAVRLARTHLRVALRQMEQNPYLADHQRSALNAGLDECEYLIRLLRGDASSWSQTDRDFLASLGVDS